MSKSPKIEVLPIEQGATYDPNNINKHTQKGGGLLENSLRKRGAFRSIASAGKGVDVPVVMAGNFTLEKAIDAGFTEVVNVHVTGNQIVNVVRDDIAPNSPEAIALGLEDNEIGKLSYNPDLDILAAVMADPAMQALRDEDAMLSSIVSGMGLKDKDVDAPAEIENAAELLKKWNVKSGDLWILGAHKLLCGDSTNKTDVFRLLGDEDYDMLADPPYNIGFNYASISNDKNAQAWVEFCEAWFSVCSKNAKGSIVTPGPRNERLYPEPRDKGIWAKKNATAGASVFYLRVCEPILFYGKFDKKRNTDLFEYSSGFSDELTRARLGAGVAESHPPAKSMPLWLELAGMLRDVIFDPFGGNGTTILACETLKKKARSIELYPPYCAVILERFYNATGITPLLSE